LGVGCRVEPVVTHPAPPQTRTCAIHASGSSGRVAAALLQSPGFPWSGFVSSKSLPCLPPADTLPDGAFPPVGRLGLTSPLSSVLCAATTATSPSQGASLVARHPNTLPASRVRHLPAGLVASSKRPDHARACGHPVPQSGHVVKETGGSPTFPSYPSRHMPRSQTPGVSCALAKAHPGLLPSGQWKPSAFLSVLPGEISLCPQRYTFRGSITRPASSLHPAPYGPLRGGTRVHY